jgi:hypothetical protein
MEDSNIVNHAAEIVTCIASAVSSLQTALDLLESNAEPSHAEVYLLARLDVAIELLGIDLPVTDQTLGFQIDATGSD